MHMLSQREIEAQQKVATAKGEAHGFIVKADNLRGSAISADLATRMRGSFLAVGPLLGRLGKAHAPHPGGCAIGTRPVSVDLKGFQAMGAEIDRLDGQSDILQRESFIRVSPSPGPTWNNTELQRRAIMGDSSATVKKGTCPVCGSYSGLPLLPG